MSYLEYSVKSIPTGFRKVLHLNWPLTLLLALSRALLFEAADTSPTTDA